MTVRDDVSYLPLTDQQREVLYHVSRGLENTEVADLLGVSLDTVKTHLYRLYRRLDARNRAHAVRRGFERGLLAADDVDGDDETDDAAAGVVDAPRPATVRARPDYCD